MSRLPLVLGIDGGGTHTRALAASADGRTMLGAGEGGACNIAAVPPEDALRAVQAASEGALAQAGGAEAKQVQAVCAGVAGASVSARRRMLEDGLRALFPSASVAVVPDYAVALAGATGGRPGMIVIAGTGSVAYGEDGAGCSHRTGGYGCLIDDAGSGYGVGRAALAAALRGADGGGPATTLTMHILDALGLADVGEIVPGVYGGGIRRETIASLARTAAQVATDDNDEQARAIFMRAGGALALLAHGVASALFAAGEESFPVVPVGGLWNAGTVLSEVFWRSLQRFAPHAVPSEAESSPVQGAVLRAALLLPAS